MSRVAIGMLVVVSLAAQGAAYHVTQRWGSIHRRTVSMSRRAVSVRRQPAAEDATLLVVER
jgi:hypothetical protein